MEKKNRKKPVLEGRGKKEKKKRKEKEEKEERTGDRVKRHTKEIDSAWHAKKFRSFENQRLTTKYRTTDKPEGSKRVKGGKGERRT